MKCTEIFEMMPDLAAGEAAPAEVSQHLQGCAECTAKLNDFRQTMALLDEWQAPEPSPYFDTRFQARLREEKSKATSSWWHWVRRPVLAGALALVVVFSVTVFRNSGITPPAPQPGTAVGDLQALDKNEDLYSSFDELDDLQVQPDVTANP